MCDEAVDDCLAALKFVPDCFVTSKKREKLDNALHANDDILFYNEDFDKASFIACQRQILQVLIKLNLIMIITFMKMILILLFMAFGLA